MTFHASCSRACAWLVRPVLGAILLTGAASMAATFALAQGPRHSAPQVQRGPAAPQVQGQPASPQAQQQRAPAQGQMTSADFRTALQPYGRWQQHSRWGEVWSPANRARDWRPYTVGRWAYTDDWGWYWISDAGEANWGWVTYHYGRWVFDPDFGWMWIPGREWSPGWVQWRHGGQYVGWAPLPPDEIVFEYREVPDVWVFVRERDFIVAPRLTAVILPVREYPVFLRETIVVNTTVPVSGAFAVNPGIPPTVVAADVGRPVPTFSVQPRVLAGTAQVPGAIQVRAQDLRGGTFRGQVMARQTQNVIRPSANVPQLQPLAARERGRLGDNPPRMARGAAPTTGQAPSQPQQQQSQRQQPSAQQPPQQQGAQRQPSAQPPQQTQQAQPPAQQRQQQGRARPEPQTQGRGAGEQRQPSAQPPQQTQQAQPPAQQRQQQGRARPEPQTQGRGAAEQRQQQRPQPPAAQPQQRPSTEGRAAQPRPSAPHTTEGRGPGPGAAHQAAPPRAQPSGPGGTVGRGSGGGPVQAAPQRGPSGGAPRGGPPAGAGHAGSPGGERP
jgi:uncharacterized protein DUF6600